MAARLRYAQRASSKGPAVLRALLQSPAGAPWRQELLLALRVMQLMLVPKLDELPDPRFQPHVWEAWWRLWPGQWQELIGRFLKAAAARPQRFAAEVRALRGICPVAQDSEPDEWVCMQCEAAPVFPSYRAYAMHRTVLHGVRRDVRHYIVGTRCPACGVDYRQRIRALEHLHGRSKRCRAMMEAGLLPRFPEPEVAAADAADRAHRRASNRAGIGIMAGPPCIRPEA